MSSHFINNRQPITRSLLTLITESVINSVLACDSALTVQYLYCRSTEKMLGFTTSGSSCLLASRVAPCAP